MDILSVNFVQYVESENIVLFFIPYFITKDTDLWPCFPVVMCNDSSPQILIHIDPHAHGTTCYTTCVWSSHTSLSMDSKINPLAPCVV